MARSQLRLRVSPTLYQMLLTTKVNLEKLLGQQVFKNQALQTFSIFLKLSVQLHLHLLCYFNLQ